MYTIKGAKQAIKNGVSAYLMKDNSNNYIMNEVNCLPFYLEGAPGIGKTEIVKQIADEMGLGYVSFSLVHHTRNSLLGLPVIKDLEDGSKYTSYTMSEIIAKVLESVSEGHDEGILLLDEFPCMSESVMPAMLAFLQTKNIGTHSLPRGWVLVLCGNPIQYNKATRSFDAAVTDRIRKIEVEYSIDDFMSYAKEKNFSEHITSYLTLKPDHMYRFSKEKGKEELVTCRGWENLSHALNLYEKLNQPIDSVFVREFLKSEEVAGGFADFYRQNTCGLTEEDRKSILAGKYDKELINRINKFNFDKRWTVLEYLMNEIKVRADKTTKKNVTTLVKELTNVFRFIACIDRDETLSERLYVEVNNNPKLLLAVSEVKCEPYVQLCQKNFGIKNIS